MSSLFEAFKAKAEAVSAEVHRFESKSEAVKFVAAFVEQQKKADDSIALWADGALVWEYGREALQAVCPSANFEVTRDRAAQARIGISQMDWAIAKTGTLVQDASAAQQRLVSTLPIIHIAFLGTERIVADLPTLLERASPKQIGYLAFITGPSRTADIERVLTIGVHGPERLIILVVDDLGRAN